MLKVVETWINRYFGEEEAVSLALVLGLSLIVIVTLGGVLTPAIASIVVAFIMQGLAARMEKTGVPHAVALWVTYVVFIGGLFAVVFGLLPVTWQQLTTLIRELPGIILEMQEAVLLLPQKYPGIINEQMLQTQLDRLSVEAGNAGQALLSASLANLPNVLIILVYLVLVPILVFFFLKDRVEILAWFGELLPTRRPRMIAIWTEMNLQMANYVRGKFIEILIVGFVSYIAFMLFGLKYSLLLAVLVGISVVIPYIGAAVVTVPVLAVGWFQWGYSSELLWLALVYLVIQALDGNVLVPLLFSEAVNLHPVAIIIAILVFGGFWGLWGVFFAIPLATLVKAILDAWPSRSMEDAALEQEQ